MNFDKLHNLILKEYTFSEGDQIYKQLKSDYKNRRIILTKDPFELKDFTQIYPSIPDYPIIRPKPRGIWYALGEDWARWVTSEMAEWWERYNHVYQLDIDYSNVLRINTSSKLQKFEEQYLTKEEFPEYGKMEGMNWGEDITKQYKGIEIIPYQWDFRNHSWYHGWDVASGCIWDSSAIKGFKEITPTLCLK